DCLINLLKSIGNRKSLPGCEAAYLTLSSYRVKPYFPGLFTLSSRPVCVFVVTTEAHYREFFDTGNSYFKKRFQTIIYHPKHPNLVFFQSIKRKKRCKYTSIYQSNIKMRVIYPPLRGDKSGFI
ncbi:hypothetical protein, partial [Xenorhabdus griffiniae]|uniref:hypothetical protein n=1 Tax=Xenorhabdus griffiniae TaxID=351672 RepID=UPI001D14B70A